MLSGIFELTSEVVVRCVHHLENPKISVEENKALYGLCYGRHGHHYRIRVSVSGAFDPASGLIFNRDQLAALLKTNLVDRLDGKDLNGIFENTSGEALAVEIYDLLLPHFPAGQLKAVGVRETRKNDFEFRPKT